MGLEQRQESEGWLAPRLYEFPRHCSLPQTFPIPSYRTSILFSILPALTIPGLGKCVGNINFTHECIYTLREGGEKCKRDGEEYTKQIFRNIATNFFLLLFLSLPIDFFFFYANREREEERFVPLSRKRSLSIHYSLKESKDFTMNITSFVSSNN